MRYKDGLFHSLFIQKKEGHKKGKWMKADCFPTKKFATRKGWHCCPIPFAPHLKMKLANGEKRIWVEVKIKNWKKYKVPESHGGTWLLAQEMKIIKPVL